MPEAKLPADQVQKLLDQVADFRKAVAATGEPGRAALGPLEAGLRGIEQELGVAAGGKLDPKAWDQMSATLQASLLDRLQSTARLLEGLTGASPDGPPDQKNIMHKAPASNFWIVALTGLGIVLTTAVLFVVYSNWDAASRMAEVKAADGKITPPATERQILGMIILMGALGGCLHWTSSLAMFVGNGQLLRRWVPYYLIMPFEGAALAPIIYLLLRTGVLATPSGNGGATTQLNLVSLYAFAGLTGLFAKQAIEMLADVFTVIFKKIQAKDPVQDKKPKGGDDQLSAGASGRGSAP